MQVLHFKSNNNPYRMNRILSLFFTAIFYGCAFPAVVSAQDKPDDFTAALSNWVSAKRLADPAAADFLPDSAYTLIAFSQRHWRKLPDNKKKKLEKNHGISQETFTEFKNQLKEGGLSYALGTGKSAAIENFLERYKPIPPKLQLPAYEARNRFFLEEARKNPDYSRIKTYMDKNLENIKRYNADLLPAFEETLAMSFFLEKDTGNIFEVLAFIQEHPELLSVLDKYLAQALPSTPYLTLVEQQLAGLDKTKLPLSAKEIFKKYAATGRPVDFTQFFKGFAEFADSSWYLNEISLMRKGPEATEVFTENYRPRWENYILAAAPRYYAWEVLLRMIEPDIRNRNWSAALEQIRRLGPAFGQNHPWVNHLIVMLEAPVQGISATPIDEKINSDLGEYSPVVSADGKEIYFCRREKNIENIYKTQWTEGKGWSEPQGVSPFLHPYKNQAPLALSADGATLILFEEARVKTSDKSTFGWSKPEPLFGELQASSWQGGTTISSDGQAVIFDARRTDRVGPDMEDNIDLFVCIKDADGAWGRPINLGPGINTPLTDRSPFLHPDMRTLYFSSAGHGGFGKLDVFKTTRIGDGWTEWSDPINLGKEINTAGGDWGYMVSTDGQTAYFSADADNGLEDLFQVSLPSDARPAAVTTIEGRLTGPDGKPIAGEIMVDDLTTEQRVTTIRPDPVTGVFFITLPNGRLYGYTVKAEGRFPVSDNIDLRDVADAKKRSTNIIAPTLEEMAESDISLPLKNVFFATDSDQLKPESFPELNRMAALIRELSLEATLDGHTDSMGAAEYNLDLSRRRAKAVRDYLVSKGIDAALVKSEGFGLTRPVAKNDTETGRALNRRVEIRLRKLQ